jgi:hypothetical protein
MALPAIRREPHGLMIGRPCHLKCLEVTAYALCGKPLPVKLPYGSDLVAGIAVRDGMGSNEWEAILMFVHRVNGNLPAVDAMTQVALDSILTAVQIGVTVLALPSDIREDRAYVAFLAQYFRVHAEQGIRGLTVIELGIGANRAEGRSSVAFLASHP